MAKVKRLFCDFAVVLLGQVSRLVQLSSTTSYTNSILKQIINPLSKSNTNGCSPPEGREQHTNPQDSTSYGTGLVLRTVGNPITATD